MDAWLSSSSESEGGDDDDDDNEEAAAAGEAARAAARQEEDEWQSKPFPTTKCDGRCFCCVCVGLALVFAWCLPPFIPFHDLCSCRFDRLMAHHRRRFPSVTDEEPPPATEVRRYFESRYT